MTTQTNKNLKTKIDSLNKKYLEEIEKNKLFYKEIDILKISNTNSIQENEELKVKKAEVNKVNESYRKEIADLKDRVDQAEKLKESNKNINNYNSYFSKII